MIIKTLNSVYEVQRGEGLFRRVGGAPRQDAPPIGVWRAFERMSPVVAGRPLRFFSLSGKSRRLSTLQTLTTSPVVGIIDGDTDHHEVVAVGGDRSSR